MLKTCAVIAILFMSTNAFARAQYCNDDMNYYIEEIPFGYAIVHMAWAEYCKKNFRTDSPDYICEGRDDYRLRFTVDGGDLTLTSERSAAIEFYGCIFRHDSRPK